MGLGDHTLGGGYRHGDTAPYIGAYPRIPKTKVLQNAELIVFMQQKLCVHSAALNGALATIHLGACFQSKANAFIQQDGLACHLSQHSQLEVMQFQSMDQLFGTLPSA